MASASPNALLRILLTSLDLAVAPELPGAALPREGGDPLNTWLTLGILHELPPAEELSPCACATPGCAALAHLQDSRAWAVCPQGLADPHPIDPRILKRFRVDVAAFCQALREANQLDGAGISNLSETITFLGSARGDGRDRPTVLARCLNTKTARATITQVQGWLPGESPLILTPTARSLDLEAQELLRSKGLVVTSLLDTQRTPGSLELDFDRVPAAPGPGNPADDTALEVLPGQHRALSLGSELELTPRAFRLLKLLARTASEHAGAWVSRRDIYYSLWPGAEDEDLVYERQIDDAVWELRQALDAAERGAGLRLVATRRGVGYTRSLLH